MAKRTEQPKKSGLTVSRNNNVFKLSWSKIKNCTDQDIIVRVNNKQVRKQDLTSGQTSYKYTIDDSDFFPNTKSNGDYKPKLKEVSFKLSQTQKKKKQSKFSAEKEFKIKERGTPKYVEPAQHSTNLDTFYYSWDIPSSDDDAKTGNHMFSYFLYETVLMDNGKKPVWEYAVSQKIQTIDPTTGELKTNQPSRGTFTSASRRQLIIRELQSDINARKTRYFHIQAVGPRGASDFSKTATHQLGGYDAVQIASKNTSFDGSSDTGTSGWIDFKLNNGNPHDSINIEYAVTAPYVTVTETGDVVNSKLIIPPGFNSWTNGDTFSGSGVKDTYSFNYPAYVTEDTMLFMRINRTHDGIVSYGVPFLMNAKTEKVTRPRHMTTKERLDWKVRGGTGVATETVNSDPVPVIGTLSTPTLTSVQANIGLKEVTITCTNTSQLAAGGNRSFIAVYERIPNTENPKVIGIIPYSSSAVTDTFKYDDDVEAFGIQCLVASYSPKTRAAEGVTSYNISNILMQSSGIIWDEGAIAKPPENVNVEKYDSSTVLITWDWNWAQANSAEISWSDNEIIWDSIEEPQSYILTNTRNGSRYITGLSPTKYYFKVRFIKTETVDGTETTSYGPYSETVTKVLSSAPDIPTLTLSDEDGVVGIDDEVTAYWTYQSTDGTPQVHAHLAEATRPNEESDWTYTKLPNAVVNDQKSYTFTPRDFGWTNGQDHRICVKVRSESGCDSASGNEDESTPLDQKGYSAPVMLKIAPFPTLTVHGINEADSDAIRAPKAGEEAYDSGVALSLRKLPIEFTVASAGSKSYCNVVIERNGAFSIDRPDDTNTTGFDHETIISKRFDPASGDPSLIHVSITADDLKLGSFDDTAKYHMWISITDEYKQTKKSDDGQYDFTVDWDHYATMPSATIQIEEDEDIAIITPTATGVQAGDFCRIYRMSADKPQLILDNGVFGTTYVDPYPTFGYYGGYRIVCVSKYMDYKTDDHMIAMTEYSNTGDDEDIQQYDKFMVALDFDGGTAEFDGNISLSHSWQKDFQLTRYLGGSMQGDWNPGIQRTGTINGTIPVQHDPETLYTLHLLADYPGRCHVRTPEGSNFIADVQVKDDREEKWTTKLSKISLSYTKVDGGEDDMMTLTEWRKMHPLTQQ